MKIALVCTEKLPVPPVAGGAIQMYIEGVLPYLSQHQDITVFSVQHPSLPDEEVRDNVRYIRVPGKTQSVYIQNVMAGIAASVDRDGTPYGLIHVFNRPKYLLTLADSFPDCKFSLSLHNEMMHEEKITDEAGLKCVEKAEFINTVSRYIADTVISRFPSAKEKMHVVYSGVDPNKYHPPWTGTGAVKKFEMRSKYGLQDYRVILYAGRLSKKKGVHILVRAMEKVMQTHPDTALVIAGSKWYGSNAGDEYTEALRKLVLQLPGPVIFTGFIPPSDIADYYCMGDIFVCASQWNEPLARVHYEAMAAGLPIITTNRGGNAEVICEATDAGHSDSAPATSHIAPVDAGAVVSSGAEAAADCCGIVIDSYRDPEVMADKISFLLDNPDIAAAMGRKGRQLAETRYSWDRVAGEIFERIGLKPPQSVEPKPEQIDVPGLSQDDGPDPLQIGGSTPQQAVEPKSQQISKPWLSQADEPDPLQNSRQEISAAAPVSAVVPSDDAAYDDPVISMIGTGYVGLVTGACLSSMGRRVICCDQDSKKIEDLRNGIMPIYEPSLKELVDNCVSDQKLSFTDDIKETVSCSDIIFITVNTPTLPDGSCDTENVCEAARSIGTWMDRYKIIVNKSTVPVGTGQKVREIISAVLAERSLELDFDVVSNPEFLREGSAIYDFMNPDRIVIGAENDRAAQALKHVYSEQIAAGIPVLMTDIETAEMVKYASNAFLAAKISFVNELANLCEECGVDITRVTRGMGLDSRIGPHFLSPGPGFGGSCFPKDVRALLALSSKYGCKSLMLRSVLDVNEDQRRRMVQKIENALGRLDGSRITILGLSFKPGTDDIRESPAVSVISSLLEQNISVAVYDPRAMESMKRKHPEMELEYCGDIYSACCQSDCIVLATEWKEFSELDFEKLKSVVRRPVFMDLRNVYEPEYVRGFGFYYEGVGRK